MKKGTLLAVAVFALLLVLVLATRERHVSEGPKKVDFSSIDKGKVNALEFAGAKSAVIRKEQGSWFVYDPSSGSAKYPADENQVTSALDALTTMQVTELVTERKDKRADYEVDDAKGVKVTVREDGKAPLQVVIGKSAKSGGIYVREASANPVFVAQGRFGWMARKEAKGWRKHSIVTIKTDEIASVTAKHKDGETVTVKPGASGGWELDEATVKPAGFRFDPQAALHLVQSLAALSAQDFLDPGAASDEQLGLAGAHDTVEAKLKDGKVVTVHIGEDVDPQSFAPKPGTDGGTPTPRGYKLAAVRLEGDSQVYLIPTYSANQLRKRLDEMRDLSLMTFEPAKATKLVIDAGKKTVAKKQESTWAVVEPKKLPAGFEFDPQQVIYQLDRLHSFKATRLVGGKVTDAEAGLLKPTGTVEISLEGGKKQVLKLGKETTGPNNQKEIYVKGAADSQLYVMGKDALTRLQTGVELFKKPPPPPPEMGGRGGMRGLESLPPDIRQKIEAQLRQQQHP